MTAAGGTVAGMEYLLTILTNGRRECFERAVHAFAQHASPAPSAIMVMDDGGQTGAAFVVETLAAAFRSPPPYAYEDSPAPIGMCKAHAHCWHAAATSDLPWVFHLEDDFVLLRPLQLDHLRETLEAEPTLTQLALVRTPWLREIPFGGYIPQFPGLYERRETIIPGVVMADHVISGAARAHWIATTRNYATNPALCRTDLCRRYPWPLEGGCETLIGPAILEDRPDAVFGLWGWGEPWAAHIGVERQPGAYGYH